MCVTVTTTPPLINLDRAVPDPERTRGWRLSFSDAGVHLPLPDDRVRLTDHNGVEIPGRVYAVNYSRQLVYVELDQEAL